MKRFILLVFLIFLCIFSFKTKVKNVFVEKIHLNLKENEIGITILSDLDNKGFLVSLDGQHFLFLFQYNNFSSLKKNLELFDVSKLRGVYTSFDRKINIFGTSSLKMDSSLETPLLKMKTKIDYMDFQMNNYHFCVYNDGVNTDFSDCDFVYLLKFSKEMDLSDHIQLLFLEEGGNGDLLKNLYEKWIDSYLVSNQYITVKILEKKYDISIIPKIGYTN